MFKTIGDTDIVKRMSFTPADKIKCLERELAIRRKVYPGYVLKKLITQAYADREIAIVEAMIADYKAMAL